MHNSYTHIVSKQLPVLLQQFTWLHFCFPHNKSAFMLEYIILIIYKKQWL